MTQIVTRRTLRIQNRAFAGTGGISQENRGAGFVPGFLDQETGAIYPACKADGTPAAVHLLDGLPESLVLARTPSGQVAAVKATVIAGFIRDGCFYTREQAACCLQFPPPARTFGA